MLEWPELAISALLEPLLAYAELKDYFPDKIRCGKLPNWVLFWGVLFTMNPDFVKNIIKQDN